MITGDALNALSDDPDELSVGTCGAGRTFCRTQRRADLYRRLHRRPTASEVVHSRDPHQPNPFSAQYDQPGYGRIEIITKPGTDKFHGGGSFQYQNKVFNTSTPFLGAANMQPNYHTAFIIGNLTGPIRPGMSFTIAGTYRDIANNNIINPPAIYSSRPTRLRCAALAFCLTSGRGLATQIPIRLASRAIAAPQKRWEINPRIDTMIGSKNTLTARYSYETANITSPRQ